MLDLEKVLATITKISLKRDKDDESRRRYSLTMQFECAADEAADLSPDVEFLTTFWDDEGDPTLTALFPLHIENCLMNCRVSIADSLGEGLELTATDVRKIKIVPLRANRARVQANVEGVLNDARPLGDRLWRLLGVPTETDIRQNQSALDLGGTK